MDSLGDGISVNCCSKGSGNLEEEESVEKAYSGMKSGYDSPRSSSCELFNSWKLPSRLGFNFHIMIELI